MAENLRRGYGGFLIYPNLKAVDNVKAHLHNLSFRDGADYFYFRDSDTHIIYEGYFDSEGQLQATRVGYDWFGLIDSEYQTNLLNGYGVNGYIVGVDNAIRVGQILRDSDDKSPHIFIVKDSENSDVYFWRRRKEFDGTDSEHYIKRKYLFSTQRTTAAKFRSRMINQLNYFSLYDISGSVLSVFGDDFITDSDDTTGRYVTHISSLGRQKPAVLWVYGYKKNIEIDFTLDGTSYENRITYRDSDQRSYGYAYTGFKATTRNKLDFVTKEELYLDSGYFLRFITEFGDSEIEIETPAFVDSEYGSFAPVIYGYDSELYTLNYGNGQEPIWRVFGDSDNQGFLNTVGSYLGAVGWRKNIRTDVRYILKRAILTNTPASQVQQWPRDFDIDGYDALRGTWSTIRRVRNHRAFVYDGEFNDSDNVYDGFRFNIVGAQPDFNPAVHGIEIKHIDFQVEKRTYFVSRTEHGFFADGSGQKYLFKVGNEEVKCRGYFIGGGGGGGSISNKGGAGGGGGGYCRVDSLTLKPNTVYQIGVGAGGAVNSVGGDSYLRDMTTGTDVIRARGGNGGSSTNLSGPVATYSVTNRTPGGVVEINDSDYTIVAYTSAGGEGGRGQAFGGSYNSLMDGSRGVDSDYEYYVSTTVFGVFNNYNVVAGGGGGAFQNYRGGSAGGPSAGRGQGDSGWTGQTGTAKRGGGGGGAGISGSNWAAGKAGGSGYVYLIFE